MNGAFMDVSTSFLICSFETAAYVAIFLLFDRVLSAGCAASRTAFVERLVLSRWMRHARQIFDNEFQLLNMCSAAV